MSSSYCFSQPTFTNLDSLLTKNFDAVNKRDSIYFLSFINQQIIFKNKALKTKNDSLLILKPFFKAFNELIASLTDMTSNSDFTVSYRDYEFENKKTTGINVNGKIPIHVNILVNNTFTLKMPHIVYITNGLYSITDPIIVMFVEGKE